MSKAAKVALIAVGVAVLIMVGLTIAGSMWLKSQGGLEGLADKAESSMREGREFAFDGHEQSECLGGALDASEGCSGIKCAVQAQLWARGCLEVATPTAGLCDEIPGPFEIMQTARWQLSVCEEHGRAHDQTCQQTVSVLQQFCEDVGG